MKLMFSGILKDINMPCDLLQKLSFNSSFSLARRSASLIALVVFCFCSAAFAETTNLEEILHPKSKWKSVAIMYRQDSEGLKVYKLQTGETGFIDKDKANSILFLLDVPDGKNL